MLTSVEPVRPGTILVHVGFHKTGTTALQSAFASTRPALLEAGVRYPGSQRSHHRAAMAVTERTWGWGSRGGRAPRASYWEGVCAEAAEHEGRVFVSSEAFALAKEPALDRIVADLGADRLQVVATLRPFARLLGSSYQQYLKYGLALPFGEWLEQVFADPPACPPSPNFWRRNDHAGVLARWAERLGPDRVTLVVLDESDRGALFRTFERLLDLPTGLLVPDPAIGAANRSMTAGESELLRLLNAAGARDWDWQDYQDRIRRGAVMRMVEHRTPGREEPGLATPAWAVQAAQEVGRRTAEAVRASQVRVIGDLAGLADPIPAGDPGVASLLPTEAAAEAVLGGILGQTRVADYAAAREAASAAASRAEQLATAQLDAERRGGSRAIAQLGTRDAARLLRQRVARAGRTRMTRAVRRAGRDEAEPDEG